MNMPVIMSLDLKMCAGLISDGNQTGNQLMEYVSSLNAKPLRQNEDSPMGKPIWEADPDPLERMDEQGNVFGITISCPLLARAGLEYQSLRSFPPTGNLTLLQASRTCSFCQHCVGDTPGELNAVTEGQLRFAKLAYPLLRPARGWIDEYGDNMPSGKRVARFELKYIFWANFFGPSYVEQFGRHFLLNAPGWRKEELEDGGILYLVTEKYSDWPGKRRHQDVRDYFRKKEETVRVFRPKSNYM